MTEANAENIFSKTPLNGSPPPGLLLVTQMQQLTAAVVVSQLAIGEAWWRMFFPTSGR